jgi:hypothetical protein
MRGGFFLGTHRISHVRYFSRAFVSVNRIWDRKSDFGAKGWVLDSGAFTQINKYGRFYLSVLEYASQIQRWSRCGDLMAAVSQDYMCEPAALRRTGLSVRQHQERTLVRYELLMGCGVRTYIMPVLQGYDPREYAEHLRMYGGLLAEGAWVGVGSVCKRNSNPESVLGVLKAILSERPDLRLHGFGLKITALTDRRVVRRLWSSDSMAWSLAARRSGKDANGLLEAVSYNRRVNKILSRTRPSVF